MLVSVLLSTVAAFAQESHSFAQTAQAPNNLNIPVQLSRTIDTDKCKVGDIVEMSTLEPVLVGSGLVMPENARLHGNILGVASRQNNQPAWVVLVIVRADWKEHSLPLRAFVASQITMKAQPTRQNGATLDKAINMSETVQRRHVRQLPQGDPPPGPLSRTLVDAAADTNDVQQSAYKGLDDLRIMQDKQGRVFLLSQKSRLKLPSGTMFMLRNQAAGPHKEADATKLASIAH